MTKLLLLLAICLGLFFRSYQFTERFFYAHDNDLASWIYKDIVIDHHLRLIGQETSSPGVFVGPLFYYLLIPFYLTTGGDPIGTLAFSWFVGLASTISLYWVFTKIINSQVGIIAAFLHAASFGMALNEREVVPTTPVFLWTIWFFYGLHMLFKGHKSSLFIFAILFALAWHINLALILLFPLIPLGLLYSHKFKLQDFIKPLLVFLVLSLPFCVFEIKHGFIQVKALTSVVSQTGNTGAVGLVGKLQRTMEVAIRNINFIYWQHPLTPYLLPSLLILILVTQPTYSLLIYPLWIALFIIFFTFQSINLSEYYLNGLNILWIAGGALLLSKLPKYLILLLLLLFTIHNLYYLLTFEVNKNGYIYKKNLVNFIKTDAAAHNYPCVSVSYITNPGFDLGYRYFFWLSNLHVNLPQKGSPVYTIVFPHSRVNKIDHSFGALGLILPEYSKYSPDQVQSSCAGDNDNLTYPMFGFTN